MKTVLVTGASQGIGLEFVRQYLSRGCQVIATSRQAAKSVHLKELKAQYVDQLIIDNLDVSDADSRKDFFIRLAEQISRVDLLINNAGIISGNEEYSDKFGVLDQQDVCRTFLVNSVAPLMMVEAAYPLLKNGTEPVVVNITSDNGSISRRNQGGKYGYCASKAALNMITKILSFELKADRMILVCLHPGWVKTPMTRNEPAPLEPEESILGMIAVIDSLTIENSGRFLDWQGNQIPW